MCYYTGMNEDARVLLPYAAGIVDGEGSLNIIHNKARSWSNPQYQSTLSVSMTHKGVIELLHSTFGGTLRMEKAHPRWKQQWTWYLGGAKLAEFLNQVLPYLVVRKRHAELILEMEATKQRTADGKPGHTKGRGGKLDSAVAARREVIHTELRRINRRGR